MEIINNNSVLYEILKNLETKNYFNFSLLVKYFIKEPSKQNYGNIKFTRNVLTLIKETIKLVKSLKK